MIFKVYKKNWTNKHYIFEKFQLYNYFFLVVKSLFYLRNSHSNRCRKSTLASHIELALKYNGWKFNLTLFSSSGYWKNCLPLCIRIRPSRKFRTCSFSFQRHISPQISSFWKLLELFAFRIGLLSEDFRFSISQVLT